MRINIRHATHYRYEQPAASALQLLRLTPRPFEGQFVRKWRVGISADARLEKSEDAFGNITHLVFLDGPLDDVEIVIEGEVETMDTQGVVRGSVERQPQHLFMRESSLTLASPKLREWARTISAAQGGEPLAALHEIGAWLYREMRFDTGATTAETPAAEAFEHRHGVCQDYAHVMIAASRSIGIPARYVSGYYLRTDTTAQDAGHAWMEACVPDLGWVAFDPANGMCAGERHVRVAIGCDSREAAPVRGARVGGGAEHLRVDLHVAQSRRSNQN